ncbi:cyclic nucleotide-binding domain-containing protein [Ktedonosporobacter rubrisoli]|uniref:Cyclic nucleotide-binding domain-containing protein n=1 Tax=Ktedonosporobacter rubrisoli TaxID=2509675 RepID=A0A4P6JYA0_KTERU|nr:cyclic nucleotide-binding domain-containing protein [Ktedonosporobacter rubrisoli]QBD80006.1 cyclic nucleotide-binding domain-containing protein [Ktedonosporobacter rubrisoli]
MQVQTAKLPFTVGMSHRSDVQPLNEEQVRFEIDMCIGCDRCMQACPVPLSSLVSIADLNRATTSDAITEVVARFTDECVMCGSCVPVCPVDNHRDLLMLSLKQRLGIPWDGKVDMSRVLSYLPAGWSVPLLLSRLREQPMFSDEQIVPDNYLLHFVATSRMLTLLPGELVLQEGEFGREIYFILDGRLELSSQGPDGKDMPIAVLRRGEYIGEHEMLTGQQRNATARAQTAVVVLEVPEQVMQRLMEIVPAIHTFFERLNTARSIETILRSLALFQGVSSVDVRQLAEQAQVKRYERDERLFSEDARDQPMRESLHLLLDGFVKVGRRTAAGTGRDKSDERIIAYRQKGDYFVGGLDMLGDRRAVTVTAITRTSVAELPRQALLALFARYPEVAQRFQERLQLYRNATAAAYSAVFEPFDFSQSAEKPAAVNPKSDAEARAGLHSLVDAGVVEGTDVLVIDLDKCIHCNECEAACERRHGHSRMNRKGMVVGNISIATACRQCQDPVCMLCSRAGIARMPSGEVYITESCIGCGICAERCPYDNISIMALDDEEDGGMATSIWQRFSSFFTKGSGKEHGNRLPMVAAPGPLNANQPIDAYGELRKKIAIKCDLCAGYNNQACVQACPTGAAIRVNPVSFFGSTEDILRRRAK